MAPSKPDLIAVAIPASRLARSADQFSLKSLFLFTTLCAMHLGLFATSPELGGVAALIGVPALLRTVAHTRRLARAGLPVTIAVQIEAHFISCSVTLAAMVASLGVLIFCLLLIAGAGHAAAAAGDELLGAFMAMLAITGVIGALAAAGATFYAIYWRTLPADVRSG